MTAFDKLSTPMYPGAPGEVILELTRRQKITIAVLIPYWIVLFIVAHIPIPQIVYEARVADKWLHFLAYLNLIFLMWFSVRPDSKARWRRGVVWLVFFAVVAYGGIDELLQPYVGRSKDFLDFLANAVGASAGLVMFAYLSFWQALLSVSAITIFGLTNLAKTDLSKLVPVMNAAFHIFAYAGFTLVWIQFMKRYLRATGIWRLLPSVGVPVCLLLVVKTASLLSGRHFAATDLLFAVLGICSAAIVSYLTGFIQPLPKPA